MRIVAGLLFACFGVQKTFGGFGGIDGNGSSAALQSLIGVAGVVELSAGLLIAAGYLCGYAAFLASGQMAAAYFVGHLPTGIWPIENKGELAVIFCFVFLYMATRGAGRWSVDHVRRRRRPQSFMRESSTR